MNRNLIASELLKAAKEMTAVAVAHHSKQGGKWYVDSNFINMVQNVYPSASLEHMGMGEFYLNTPDGKLQFDRMRGRDFEGQVGRSHQLYDDANGKVVKKAIQLMDRAGKSLMAKVDSIGDTPSEDTGEHEPVASSKVAGQTNLLDSVLPMKEVANLRKHADEQSYKLAREVYRALMKRLELSNDENEAINRLANAARSTNEGMIRNQIFKAAHALGIKLPSSSF